MTIRILIADDHPVVRAGLRTMFKGEDTMEVVGEVADGAAAVSEAARLSPTVVLMDLQMPILDGVSATAKIRATDPAPQVLVLTTYDTDNDVLRAVEAGAIGYLLKDTPRTELLEAIAAAAVGKSVLAPEVAARLVNFVGTPKQAQHLTPRELEVLSLVAQGETNKSIARHLRISEATVKTHLLHVFSKLDVDDRTAAVTVAIRAGILRLG